VIGSQSHDETRHDEDDDDDVHEVVVSVRPKYYKRKEREAD
jgi:hypothetical protein